MNFFENSGDILKCFEVEGEGKRVAWGGVSTKEVFRGESVEMRVGIHSGKVICGFVGHTRYKYDVLSADVFKANDMESCG